MNELQTVFTLILGIFFGAFMMLGIVALAQFLMTKDICLSSLYPTIHYIAEGFFTIRKP